MKLRLYIGGLIAFSVLFSSCGKDSEEGESFEPHTYNVSGKVEKGPFVSGSTITIQPMDSKLQVRGDFYIIRKSKFPQNPKRSVRFSGKGTKRSVQKRKARNTQKAETKVL